MTAPLHTDKDLCKLIAMGDAQAFQTLFVRQRDSLFAFVVNFTKSENAAEDIIQEVFLKIWEQRKILVDIDNPANYIFILVRNKTLDYLRKLIKDKRLQQETWENITQLQASTNNTSEHILANDTKRLINQAVEQLSPQQRKVFLLSRTGGLNHEEIANQLGISKNTVKNHLTTSILLIRKYLVRHSHIEN